MEPLETPKLKKQYPWLPAALTALCVAQPVLDVLSYWLLKLASDTTVSLVLRMLLLMATVVFAFALSDRKRIYWITVALLAALAGGHVFACIRAAEASGSVYTLRVAFSDLTNFVRVAQFPLFTIAFMTCFKRCGAAGYAAVERGMMLNFILIAGVELLSAITGTNPYTYPNKSIGLVGWFYFANCQSAVLSMLIPLVLCTVMRRGKPLQTAVVAVVAFSMLYLFATRLTYLSIFIIAVGTLFTWAVTRKLDRRAAAILLLCTALCAAGFRVSPMYRNQAAVAANAVKKQENIDQLVQQGKAEFGNDGCAYLAYAYDEYLGGLVDKYGLERVAETFQYSTDVADITDVRSIKLTYCRMLLEDLPASSRLFGICYDDMTYDGYCYDVENDFHGILYLYGYAGLLCLAGFLLYFFWQILRALLTNAKQYFTVEAGACGIALCTGLLHAYATAGMLRRPNATFYLSAVLAMIWYLIHIRHYGKSKETPNVN